MGQEVELKLELDRQSADALGKQALFAKADRRSQRQVSVYYDTAASGWTHISFLVDPASLIVEEGSALEA